MAAQYVNFAAYGQVGFPRQLLPCRQWSGFPLKLPTVCCHIRDLIALKSALQSKLCPMQNNSVLHVIQPRSFPQ